MNFPNAGKGIGRIYLSEMLKICAAIAMIGFFVVLAVNQVDLEHLETAADSVTAPALVLAGGSLVLMVIALILNLVGLIGCSKDDSNFRIALWATLGGLAVSALRIVFQTRNLVVNDWLDVCMRILELFASYYILTGVISLAQQMNSGTLSALAGKARSYLCYAFIVTALVELLDAILRNPTVDRLLGIMAAVLGIVAYVIMLRVLSEAKKALN